MLCEVGGMAGDALVLGGMAGLELVDACALPDRRLGVRDLSTMPAGPSGTPRSGRGGTTGGSPGEERAVGASEAAELPNLPLCMCTTEFGRMLSTRSCKTGCMGAGTDINFLMTLIWGCGPCNCSK